MKNQTIRVLAVVSLVCASEVGAQNAPPPGGGGGAVAAFPGRPRVAPEVLARGKAAYLANCAYCHGEDARGGENGGTNLLRSDAIMKDSSGTVLRDFLLNPNGSEHMGVREGPQKFNVTPEQAAGISAFIRSFPLNSRDPGRMRPPTVLVGDAKAGEAYFQAKCASCHSATGDLKGIAARVPDPLALQQTWLMPRVIGGRGGAPRPGLRPVTVTVTPPKGPAIEGTLGRIDDFIVTLIQADGVTRSFRREGDTPKVEVHNPMKPHIDLLSVYTDTDIHNVTAYLAGLR